MDMKHGTKKHGTYEFILFRRRAGRGPKAARKMWSCQIWTTGINGTKMRIPRAGRNGSPISDVWEMGQNMSKYVKVKGPNKKNRIDDEIYRIVKLLSHLKV